MCLQWKLWYHEGCLCAQDVNAGNITSCEILGNAAKQGGGLYVLGARLDDEERKVGKWKWVSWWLPSLLNISATWAGTQAIITALPHKQGEEGSQFLILGASHMPILRWIKTVKIISRKWQRSSNGLKSNSASLECSQWHGPFSVSYTGRMCMYFRKQSVVCCGSNLCDSPTEFLFARAMTSGVEHLRLVF